MRFNVYYYKSVDTPFIREITVGQVNNEEARMVALALFSEIPATICEIFTDTGNLVEELHKS